MNTVTITLFLFLVTNCAEFSHSVGNFGIELLNSVQPETDGHVVISPFGIWTLLTGLTLGATGNSRNELVSTLLLPEDSSAIIDEYTRLTKSVVDPNSKGVTLTSKNFIFLDKGFNILPEYRETMMNDFGTAVENLDFQDSSAAADAANKIIKNAGSTVPNVLKPDDFAEPRMILTNVISFKGFWAKPFDVSNTKLESFYDENRNEVGKVNMMFMAADFPYSNIKEISSRVLELPYGDDGKYSMLIILPNQNTKVADIYSQLTSYSVADILQRLQTDIDTFGLPEVDVKLPRFKINTNIMLKNALNNMGVNDIFDSQSASLDLISNEPIYVSAMVHNADIEVTEEGTVASGITNIQFTNKIAGSTYYANKPFIYLVVDKPSTTVIFSGIYSKPSIF